jgi:hypothetical protein
MEIKIGRKKYSNLSEIEYYAISRYLDRNDLEILENLILRLPEFTTEMRRFIADLVTGKVSRPAGKKPSVEIRDRRIVKGIIYLLKKGHKLTSSKNIAHGDGAAAIMAKRFGVSEDVALYAYKRLKHDEANIMRIGLDDVVYYNDLPEPPKRGRKKGK